MEYVGIAAAEEEIRHFSEVRHGGDALAIEVVVDEESDARLWVLRVNQPKVQSSTKNSGEAGSTQ